MKHYILILITILSSLNLYATNKVEYVFTPANQLTLIGKASNEGEFFHRVDTAKYNKMPRNVKRLFTNSAGLAISFKTNSETIVAKWTVPNKKQGANMTPIMQKGLDLYIKDGGKWFHAGAGSPSGVDSERTLVTNMEPGEKECLLYLPLYDEITNLEIGVTKGANIEAGNNPFKGKIVVYGSSITQGASASRPGLAYPAILSRSSGHNFVNMGLSGSGKMEKEVAEMLAEIDDVDAYIMDCIPNPSPNEINSRTVEFVNTVRNKKPEVPIIFFQSVIREKGTFDTKVRKTVQQQNEAITAQFNILKKQGVKNIYLIKEDNFLGTDHEGSIDGAHPTDVGFERMMNKYKPAISKILKIKFKQ